jgi:hypothetical protein
MEILKHEIRYRGGGGWGTGTGNEICRKQKCIEYCVRHERKKKSFVNEDGKLNCFSYNFFP